MASGFSHAFVAAALAIAAPPSVSNTSFVALLCAASVAPDLDVLAFAIGIPYESALGHRGFTHSIPFAAALAVCVWIFDQRKRRRLGLQHQSNGPLSTTNRLWRSGLVFAAVASHGLLDAATDGGLGVGFWIPFDSTRHFLPWRPIPVSPIGIEAFISERGLAILTVEMRWIWAPTAATFLGVLYLRRRLAARAGDNS